MVFDVPPPGAGFTTVIENVPGVTIFAAGTIAVSWLPETYVVVSELPFHATVDAETKFVPFTVSVKSLEPENVDVGEMEVIVGTGFCTETASLSAEVTPVDAAQIRIASPTEYCIAVYVRTPAVTAALSAGVDVNVPVPAVPPHTCVERTAVRVTVLVLSDVTVLPNWS